MTLAAGLLAIPALAGAASASALAATAGKPGPAAVPAGSPRLAAAAGPLAIARARAEASLHPQVQHSSSITGTVLGAHGLPLAGACVTAYGRPGSITASAGTAGQFTIAGLAPGSYILQYRDCAAPSRYLTGWSGGVAWQRAAASIQVGEGQVRHVPLMLLRTVNPAGMLPDTTSWRRFLANASGRALSAAAAGSTGQISGVVTGKGKPLRGICVITFPVNGGEGYGASTRKNGSYTIRYIPAGRYQVTFAWQGLCHDGNWLQQLYRGRNSPFPFGGNVVRVRPGKTTRGISAALLLGGEISGKVTTKTGKGLAGICVNAQASVRGGSVGFEFPTSGTGSYDLKALFPGRYKLSFSIGCGSRANYAPATHPAVRIGYGKIVKGVNGVLVPGGVITGTVRSHTPVAPLAGICVNAASRDGSVTAFASTGANGTYRLIGLGTGNYQVNFSAGCNNNGDYLPGLRYAHVTEGKVTGGIGIELLPGAQITGVVTDTHASPLSGICINVVGPGYVNISGGTETDGSYLVSQMAAGTYQLGFTSGCGNNGNYAPYWYDNQEDESLATPIVVAAASSQVINAQLQPGGEISGAVTDTHGRKLGGVCVSVASQPQSQFGSATSFVSTARGSYHLSGLEPGQYLVDFGCGLPGRYAGQWFPGSPTAASAELISVPGGQTTGISAVLRPAGAIAGVVRAPSGKPLADACVAAYTTSGQEVGGDLGLLTNRHGGYKLGGLAAGRYDVLFSECAVNTRYPEQWYRGQTTQLTATPVTVRAGATTSRINATFTVGGTVTGRVVNGSGKPVTNVCVFAYNNHNGLFAFGITGKNGRYSMRGVATGSYTAEFSPCFGAVNLVSSFGHFRITAPHALSGVNGRLVAGGSASGTITVAGSGTPANGACAEFISANPANPGADAFTDATGGYRATGIAPGTYQVYFGDPLCGFGPPNLAPQWYNDQPTQATATSVTITVNHTTTGIDAALQPDGVITGKVLGPASAAIGGICVTAWPLVTGSTPVVAVSGKTGEFTLTGMLPGRYKVEFSSGCGASGYRTQWWDNAASRQQATVITVNAAQTVPGIHATLSR